MMRIYKPIYICILLLLSLIACNRDELCYLHPEGAIVRLNVDWSYCRLKPNSATLVIHTADGAHYKTIEMDDPHRQTIDLPMGEYHLLVLNEAIHDDGPHAATLGFKNINMWNNFEVYAREDYVQSSIRATTPYRVTPDTLGVDRLLNLKITKEMINNIHIHPTLQNQVGHFAVDTAITMVPKRPFSVTNLKINFHNFKGYAISKQYPPVLHGMAESYYLGLDKYSIHPVKHAITLTELSRSTKADATNITSFIASFTVIGLLDGLNPGMTERPDYRLEIRILYKGGIIIKDIDLYQEAMMELIKEPDHEHPEDHINIEIDIVLDELVGTDEGWDVDLEEWEDQDVPLDKPKLKNG